MIGHLTTLPQTCCFPEVLMKVSGGKYEVFIFCLNVLEHFLQCWPLQVHLA